MPLEAPPRDSHLERPVRKSASFSFRCGRHGNRDGMHINPELTLPELQSSTAIATVMNPEIVVERHTR
jgi:hypothetical protein